MATQADQALASPPRARKLARDPPPAPHRPRARACSTAAAASPSRFDVDARVLRHALAARGAVLELAIGGDTTPAVLKDAQYHPVRGETLHVDLLRVRLDVAIQATVMLDLVGADEAAGRRRGRRARAGHARAQRRGAAGRHPRVDPHDVSKMVIGDTRTLAAVAAPEGVTLLDDIEETVIATLNAAVGRASRPRRSVEEETELVGEGEGEAAEGGEARRRGAGRRGRLRRRVAGRRAAVRLRRVGARWTG